MAVAFAHFQLFYPGYANAPFMWGNAVDLFFVLSGFTLSYVYRREDFQFSGFLTARIARIYPLYFLTTVIAGAAIIVPLQFNPTTYPLKEALSDLTLQALMLNAWPFGSDVHWNVTAWSISSEWFCYLVLFPLLLYQKVARSAAMRLLCIVVLSATSYSIFVRYYDGDLGTAQIYHAKSEWSYWVPLLRGVFGFTAGWVVFACYERRDGLYTFCTRASALIWSTLIVGVVLAYRDLLNPQALVFIHPFVVLAATDQGSATSRLLGSRPLHFLGVISYSIYMTHYILFVGYLAAYGVPSTWSAQTYVLLACTTLAVFAGSYFFFERPARDVIRSLQHLRPAQTSA
ncbi:peptidoglycan/LPS O-acetylase OafA/YrhL [Bradyrhizobium macuxiense]|uniref:Peptidoglycan/LPS O-acetylase OafA/YrhL n=2 Tax=Bradyrhizobium macuxiense TaxID=1755647 RepID=A0A560L331_9BRAD|nr:peptidoglycan/LPS O-acetylase OafA/YrhL [Bradyrhizobium macuxiense]